MFKVVIVEDEKKTLEGLKKCINWSEYNLEIVGEARNGAEALKVIELNVPDIVVTDIKMPVMDGIALAEEIRRRYGEMKVIFVSGYSDIDYLKSAFKIEAVDYVFKPVDIEELKRVMEKTSEQCSRANKVQGYRKELEARINESLPFLREQFLRELVSGEIGDSSLIEQRKQFLDLELQMDINYSTLIIKIDNFLKKYGQVPQFDKKLVLYGVQNVAEETIKNYTKGFVFSCTEDEVSVLLALPEDEESIEQLINDVTHEIHVNLNNYLKLSTTIGIGLWVKGLENIRNSYKQALVAVSQKLYEGSNRIIYANKLYISSEEGYSLKEKDFEEIYMSLRTGDFDRVKEMLREIFDEVKLNRGLGREHIQSISLQVMVVISRFKVELSKVDPDMDIDTLKLIEKLFSLETVEEIKDFLIGVAKAICDRVYINQNASSNKLVSDIKKIIDTKYEQNLTINNIAKDVYLTPSYACLLFKQETGETINEYLTKVRMEKAKEMLESGKHKIYDISLSVGYSDPKYFSKLFKKVTGKSPSEYI